MDKEVVLSKNLAYAKVSHSYLVVFACEQYVLRLKIGMDDALLMDMLESQTYLDEELPYTPFWDVKAGSHSLQVLR